MTAISLGEAINQYSKQREIYLALAQKIKDILQENLEDAGVNYSSVDFRAKNADSLEKKLEKKVKDDPSYNVTKIYDLAGIRVIAYVHSDLELIRPIIRRNFEIKKYKDKTEDLGTDKVGYRSEHFIATLPENRLSLPEYEKFNGLIFEIQLRTILEHSWAQIEHDRRYKFSGVLPEGLNRRFSLLSAVLELADNEFDNISQSIDQYAADVSQKAKSGDLNISINSTSLKQYLDEKFKNLTFEYEENGLDDYSYVLIRELNDMGIDTLKKLDEIIPEDYAQKVIDMKLSTEYIGTIRDILIIEFKEDYFNIAWKEAWGGIEMGTIPLYDEYNVDTKSIINKFGLQPVPDD